MDKREFSKKLAQRCNVSDEEAWRLLYALSDEIREALSEGDEVRLPGLCRFWVEPRPSRKKSFMGKDVVLDSKVKVKCSIYPSVEKTVEDEMKEVC